MNSIVYQNEEVGFDQNQISFLNSTLYKYMSKDDQLKAVEKFSKSVKNITLFTHK